MTHGPYTSDAGEQVLPSAAKVDCTHSDARGEKKPT